MVSSGKEDGVSVIIGTLMLILVVVTAAAGLALMVSSMQKDAMTRQAHIADVGAEQLTIQNIFFSMNPQAMNVTPCDPGCLLYGKNVTDSRNWSSLRITVLNLNTKDSSVQGVGIGTTTGIMFALNYSSDGILYNASHWLTIPATQAKTIQIDPLFGLSSPVFIDGGTPVNIRIVTSLYNIFEKTFRPPTAVIKWHTETDDLTVAKRDVLLLDGTDSTSDGTITSWNWTLADVNGSVLGYYEGSKPRVICPSTGPFLVNLSVTDDTGMKGVSLQPVQIPADTLFDPPVNLDVRVSGQPACQAIMATVSDINGRGVQDVTVSFIRTSGNLTLDSNQVVTDGLGNATVLQQPGTTGIVEVSSGNLPHIDRNIPICPSP